MGDLVNTIRLKQERIIALKSEIAQLEAELNEAKKALGVTERRRKPRDLTRGLHGGSRIGTIKIGSTVDYAIKALKAVNRPLTIAELMSEIERMSGREVKKPTLVSNLSRYVQAKDIFTRTGPSTFGLKDFDVWIDETKPAV